MWGTIEDAVDAEQVHAEDERLEGVGVDPAAGVAEDLGVAGREAEQPQRVDPRVHAGDDGDAGVGDAVEPAGRELGRRVAPVGLEEVVESLAGELSVLAHSSPGRLGMDMAIGLMVDGEEVVALVVDDDERGEVLDLDLPDRLHAELGVLEHLDVLDAVLGEPRRRAADRAEVEAAVRCRRRR